MTVLIELFIAFLKIGLLSIGGGYAAMPLIQSETLVSHNWLTLTEFNNLVTISEMTPGSIAINGSRNYWCNCCHYRCHRPIINLIESHLLYLLSLSQDALCPKYPLGFKTGCRRIDFRCMYLLISDQHHK